MNLADVGVSTGVIPDGSAVLIVNADTFRGEHFKILRCVASQAPPIAVLIVCEKCRVQRDFLVKYCQRIGMNNVSAVAEQIDLFEIYRVQSIRHVDASNAAMPSELTAP